MNWILENYTLLLEILGGIYVTATVLATVTPTGKDKTFLQKVGFFFDKIGIQIKK